MASTEKQFTNFMGSRMTLDDIKDKVPSSIRLIPDDDADSIDVIIDGTYTGYLYITPDGVYFRTLWGSVSNSDDYIRISKFLSYFKYDLLFTIRYHTQDYRIYRLSE